MQNSLRETLGNIDIYLFDQILKGRYDHCEKVLDVGCGSGRNLIYFLRNGYQVFGIDPDVYSIAAVKELSTSIAPENSTENFTVGSAEHLAFENSTFDLVVCSAVLHFAKINSILEQCYDQCSGC